MPQPDGEVQPTDEPTPPDGELLAKVQELLSNVELVDIRPCAIEARIENGIPPRTHVGSVGLDLDLSFTLDEGVYGNRFDYTFRLTGDADEELGQVKFSLLVDYDVTENYTPDRSAADFVTTTTGYFAAYPYARELFQSLASRLQIDPVVLGLIRRGTLQPGTISAVPAVP
jgi:hypothetical protein